MREEPERSRRARAAAEAALVRVVHPELLCSKSEFDHAGTTDVDVQVDLEIASGTVKAVRLEQALKNAEFKPTGSV